MTGESRVNHELQPRLRDVRHAWGRRQRALALSDHAAPLLDLDG